MFLYIMKKKNKMNKIFTLIICLTITLSANAQWANAVIDSLTNNNLRDEVRRQSIAVDDNNTVHVVYIRARAAGGWVVYYRQKPQNQQWTNEVMVSDTNFAAFRPALAVNKSSGIPYVTYAQDPGFGMDIYLASDNGSGWVSNNITSDNTDDEAPTIAVDGNGSVHLAWIGLDSLALYRIFYATNISGNWDIQILSNSVLGQFGSGAEPFIATTTAGTAHIIYRGGGFSNYSMDHAYNTFPGSNSWLYENIITPNTEDYTGVITIGPDSILNVAITGSGGFGFPSDVYYLSQSHGSPWSFPQQINSNFNGEAYSIFLDTAGFVHISINELSGNIYTGNVYYASDLQGGGGWLVTPLLTTGDIYNASLILDPQNYGYAIAFQGGSTFESQEIIIFAQPDTITQINTISVFDGVLIYPNPSHNYARIKVNDTVLKNVELTIRDLTGKIILENKFRIIQDDIELPSHNFNSGIYFLQLKMEKHVKIFKLVVNK
jgi:hypothetical protein